LTQPHMLPPSLSHTHTYIYMYTRTPFSRRSGPPRYMPEPDVPTVHLAPGLAASLAGRLPMLPAAQVAHLVRNHGLSSATARALVSMPGAAPFFHAAAAALPPLSAPAPAPSAHAAPEGAAPRAPVLLANWCVSVQEHAGLAGVPWGSGWLSHQGRMGGRQDPERAHGQCRRDERRLPPGPCQCRAARLARHRHRLWHTLRSAPLDRV
jgi:hypothetical protein